MDASLACDECHERASLSRYVENGDCDPVQARARKEEQS